MAQECKLKKPEWSTWRKKLYLKLDRNLCYHSAAVFAMPDCMIYLRPYLGPEIFMGKLGVDTMLAFLTR